MERKELTLQEVQQGGFEVLLKLIEIFDKHGWKYYLAYGSLIGAVRHHGFIPWDDDIDIWVPRKDYEAFVQYCIEHEKELDYFKLMHYKTNKDYPYVLARFADTRYEIDYKGVKNYGLGLFVDIYPLDDFDPEDKAFKQKINDMIHDLSRVKQKGENQFLNVVKFLLRPLFLWKHGCTSSARLIEKIDKFGQKYNGKGYDYTTCTVWEVEKCPYKKEYFGDRIPIKFEGVEILIPAAYDDILKLYYGNYMELPPEEKRIAQHFYKAYRKE